MRFKRWHTWVVGLRCFHSSRYAKLTVYWLQLQRYSSVLRVVSIFLFNSAFTASSECPMSLSCKVPGFYWLVQKCIILYVQIFYMSPLQSLQNSFVYLSVFSFLLCSIRDSVCNSTVSEEPKSLFDDIQVHKLQLEDQRKNKDTEKMSW